MNSTVEQYSHDAFRSAASALWIFDPHSGMFLHIFQHYFLVKIYKFRFSCFAIIGMMRKKLGRSYEISIFVPIVGNSTPRKSLIFNSDRCNHGDRCVERPSIGA